MGEVRSTSKLTAYTMATSWILLLLALGLVCSAQAPPRRKLMQAETKSKLVAVNVLESLEGDTGAVLTLACSLFVCLRGAAWFAYYAFGIGCLLGAVLFMTAAQMMVNASSSVYAVLFMLLVGAAGFAAMVFILRDKRYLAVFFFGGAWEIGFAWAVLALAGRHADQDKLLFFLVCTAAMLLMGQLFLLFERPLLLISTSILGSLMVSYGVSYYVHDFPTLGNVAHWLHSSQGKIPIAWFLYWSAMVIILLVSLVFQFHTTKQVTNKEHRSSADEYAVIA